MGGPAIVSSVLVGVISFGPPMCGAPDAPVVFTNIGDYADWIDSVASIRHTTTLSSKQSARDQSMIFTETHLGKKHLKLRKQKSLDNYPHAVILLTSLISGILHKRSRSGKFQYKLKEPEQEDTVIMNPKDIIQVLSSNPKILKHYVNIVKSWLRSGVSSDGAELYNDLEPDNFWTTTTQRLHEVDKINPTEPSVLSALYDSIEDDTDQFWKKTTLSFQNYQSLADMAIGVQPIQFPTETVLLDMFAQLPQSLPLLDESLQKELLELEEIAKSLYDPKELKKQIMIENKRLHNELLEGIMKHYSDVRKGKRTRLYNTFTRYPERESKGKKKMMTIGNSILQEYKNENYETDYDRSKDYNLADVQNYIQFEQPIKKPERSDLRIHEVTVGLDLVQQYDNYNKMQNRYLKNTLSKPENGVSKKLKMGTDRGFILTTKHKTLLQQTRMSFTAVPEYLADYDAFHYNANQDDHGEETSQERNPEGYLLNLNI